MTELGSGFKNKARSTTRNSHLGDYSTSPSCKKTANWSCEVFFSIKYHQWIYFVPCSSKKYKKSESPSYKAPKYRWNIIFCTKLNIIFMPTKLSIYNFAVSSFLYHCIKSLVHQIAHLSQQLLLLTHNQYLKVVQWNTTIANQLQCFS